MAGRTLCGLCVDNVAGYTLDIGTAGGHATGPVHLCQPCLVGRVEAVAHDIWARHHGIPVVVADVERFAVETLP